MINDGHDLSLDHIRRSQAQPGSLQPAGSDRSGLEVMCSLRREGWREDIMGMVFVSRDRTLVKVVWPDGKTAETRIEPNTKVCDAKAMSDSDSTPPAEQNAATFVAATGYVASWPERLEEQRRYGLLLGALQGVSWQVGPELRKRIDKILREVEPHTNASERIAGPRS